ncbi:MAG: aminodeoxychorismate synthase component I [Gammaproteobacteria bacterium]|nr:aminodeoxychorismate synthase component I [Gammaproteobacteria bacterium]
MPTPSSVNQYAVTIRRIDVAVDLLKLHHQDPQRYPHLLESVSAGPQGQYDILFAFPQETLTLNAQGDLTGESSATEGNDFLTAFDQWWQGQYAQPSIDSELPFLGGWFVYLGYELAAQIEPGLSLPAPSMVMPTAFATRFPCAILHDRQRHQSWLMAEQKEGSDNIHLMEQDVLRAGEQALEIPALSIQLHEDNGNSYCTAVETILEYIRAGDVFQVNLSRQWNAVIDEAISNTALYDYLRKNNPGPFNGLATGDWGAVISSSPERLVRVKGDLIETRPIAGTRPRNAQGTIDQALSEELLNHPKEQAEHIMLLDLERNDLGRVCRPGSIEVDEMMVLESYAHVHHIVSNVRGHLRPGISPADSFRAVFPGGTITGCPKVRCMEIIAELEQEGRGAYTGSMGYVNRNGDMDLNILIRSLSRQQQQLSLRAGAGIVADSIAVRELEETRSKAKGLLWALGSET